VLVDTEFLGQDAQVLAWPNRNGFFYLIDRTNGKFLSATAFVKQTWNDGFDYENNGRPKVVPGMEPTPEGNDKVWPGIDGGANWMAHSYSPLTKLLYVFAREEHRAFTKNEVPHPTTEERAGPPELVAAAAAAGLPVLRQRKVGGRPSVSTRRQGKSRGSTRSSLLRGAD
jgi:hypothetical protein